MNVVGDSGPVEPAAAVAAVAGTGSSAAGSDRSAAGSDSSAMSHPEMWLPSECWQPLAVAAGCSTQQAQQQLLPGAGQSVALSDGEGGVLQPDVYLQYSSVQQLQARSSAVQKVQQLLLQLHMEAKLGPAILACLHQGMGVSGGHSGSHNVDAHNSVHGQQLDNMHRHIALYRLAQALLVHGSHGGATGCQFAGRVQDDT